MTLLSISPVIYRASRDTQIPIEGADSLTGTWERIGDLARLGYTGRQVEGPAFFQFNGEQKWALLVDKPGKGDIFRSLSQTSTTRAASRVSRPTPIRLAPAKSATAAS